MFSFKDFKTEFETQFEFETFVSSIVKNALFETLAKERWWAIFPLHPRITSLLALPRSL